MAWGMFKKVAVADRLAMLVDKVYADPASFDGAALLLGTVFFAFQIYCDFSGYSDIARGSAEVMGFKLMTNFNRPYAARSVSEFWKRWHISLSTWFKDYVYLPLGGSRVSAPRWAANVMAVFLLSGLWHGAGWTFIAWGALNGLYLIGEAATAKAREGFSRAAAWTACPGSARRPGVDHLRPGLRGMVFSGLSMADARLILESLARVAGPAETGRGSRALGSVFGGSKPAPPWSWRPCSACI